MKIGRRRREEAEVESSSLNDIMFFLLLFFLIASTLANPNVIRVTLPTAKTTQTVAPKSIPLTVRRDPENPEVLQVFIENAMRGSDLVIQGDGQESLDFTYIGDLISGLQLLLLNEKGYGQVFNLTRGKAQKLIDAAKIVQNKFPSIDLVFQERDSLNPERGSLDISKAQSLLGYTPVHDLTEGLDSYISWYKEKESFFEKQFKILETNE